VCVCVCVFQQVSVSVTVSLCDGPSVHIGRHLSCEERLLDVCELVSIHVTVNCVKVNCR
jgi:hypothetical protein